MTLRTRWHPPSVALARKVRGLSTAALAALIGATDEQVIAWERGEGSPDAFALANLSNVLDVLPDFFYAVTVPTTLWDGEKFAAIRMRKGFSRRALSRSTGIPVETLRAWEGDAIGPEPSFDCALSLVRVLGAKWEDFARGPLGEGRPS